MSMSLDATLRTAVTALGRNRVRSGLTVDVAHDTGQRPDRSTNSNRPDVEGVAWPDGQPNWRRVTCPVDRGDELVIPRREGEAKRSRALDSLLHSEPVE